jgi:uncharacterized membrane protein
MTEPEAPQTPPPPPPETSTPTEGGESGNRGLMIALSYLWLLALVPLLVEKDDAEVQWHAKHGLVLMVAEVILWIVLAVLSAFLGPLACALAIFQMLLFLGVIVVHILCIVKGVGGERFVIPGITQYADKF